MFDGAEAEDAVVGNLHVDGGCVEQCADRTADGKHEQAGQGKKKDEVAADEV